VKTRFVPILIVLLALGGAAPRVSLELVAEALPLTGFATASNELSRYLTVVRRSEARTARFGGIVPVPLESYDSNELRFAPIRPPDFTINPAWFALGARAHVRLTPAVGLIAEALIALAEGRQDAFSRWFLTDPADGSHYLGTLSVQARDQSMGTAALFSAGVRLQHPAWVFFGIQPYLQASAGGGPLFSYGTTTRYLAMMQENWVAGGPTAFTNFQQSDLSLVHTLTDDGSFTRIFSGGLFRYQVKLGLAFSVYPKWTARLEVGLQGFGLWASATKTIEVVNRGEFATSGLLIDPITYLPTDYLDYPGAPVFGSQPSFTRFITGLATAVSLERRF
jgi:hypothetical protein